MKKTDTNTLIAALYILANEIESGDGVANAVIYEAAERLTELYKLSVIMDGLNNHVDTF